MKRVLITIAAVLTVSILIIPMSIQEVLGVKSTAFTVIEVKAPGQEAALIPKLKMITNVKEVKELFGVYDIIVKVEANSYQEVHQTIHSGIRNPSNLIYIKQMLTMVVK